MIPSRKFNKKFFTTGAYQNYKEVLIEWVPPVAKRISKIIKDKSIVKILDVGCGFGTLLAELQNKYHFLVEGLDFSSYAIQNADPSVKTKIKKGNILKLPFKKDSFDVVICFDLIYYFTFEETKKAIKNLVNLSRKYIFFNSIYRHSIESSQKHNPDPLRLTTLTEKEYIFLFSQNGAKLITKFYGENGGNILVFKKTPC